MSNMVTVILSLIQLYTVLRLICFWLSPCNPVDASSEQFYACWTSCRNNQLFMSYVL